MSLFKTDCGPCVFNFGLEDDKVDCSLGRYSKFKEIGQVNGTTIQRLCSACRNIDWLKATAPDDSPVNESSFGPYEDKVMEELKNKFSLLIIDLGVDKSVEKMKTTLGVPTKPLTVLERLQVSLSTPQTIDPVNIVLVYQGEECMDPIRNFLVEYTKDKKTKFCITKIFEQEYENEILDVGARSCKGQFYTVQINGELLNPVLFEWMYKYIEEDLKQFVLVDAKTLNGFTVNTLTHQRLNGFKDTHLVYKVEEKLYQEDRSDLIVTMESLEDLYE